MNRRADGDPATILLVEDNPGDVRLIAEAFNELLFKYRLHVARDGVEALNFLTGTAAEAKAAKPDLILLDLNLPRMDGRQLLVEIKSRDALRKIPVIILTSSSAETDINRCYELNANCFLTKPSSLDEFLQLMEGVGKFWLD